MATFVCLDTIRTLHCYLANTIFYLDPSNIVRKRSHMKKKKNQNIYNTYIMCHQDAFLCLVTVCCCNALNKTLSRCNLKKGIVCVLFLSVFTVVKYKYIALLSKVLICLDGVLFHLTFQNVFYCISVIITVC